MLRCWKQHRTVPASDWEDPPSSITPWKVIQSSLRPGQGQHYQSSPVPLLPFALWRHTLQLSSAVAVGGRRSWLFAGINNRAAAVAFHLQSVFSAVDELEVPSTWGRIKLLQCFPMVPSSIAERSRCRRRLKNHQTRKKMQCPWERRIAIPLKAPNESQEGTGMSLSLDQPTHEELVQSQRRILLEEQKMGTFRVWVRSPLLVWSPIESLAAVKEQTRPRRGSKLG